MRKRAATGGEQLEDERANVVAYCNGFAPLGPLHSSCPDVNPSVVIPHFARRGETRRRRRLHRCSSFLPFFLSCLFPPSFDDDRIKLRDFDWVMLLNLKDKSFLFPFGWSRALDKGKAGGCYGVIAGRRGTCLFANSLYNDDDDDDDVAFSLRESGQLYELARLGETLTFCNHVGNRSGGPNSFSPPRNPLSSSYNPPLATKSILLQHYLFAFFFTMEIVGRRKEKTKRAVRVHHLWRWMSRANPPRDHHHYAVSYIGYISHDFSEFSRRRRRLRCIFFHARNALYWSIDL